MDPSQSSKICAITGANGYLGSKISDYFLSQGWTVWKLTRTQEASRSILFNLVSGVTPQTLQDHQIKVLIHCAYDFKAHTAGQIRASNVEGTLKLFEAAKTAGIERIIFISSMAAFEGCRSLYGQAKLQVEKKSDPSRVISVRPGLVLGKKPGGIVGSILKIISKTPIAPMIGSGTQPMYLTYDEDLAKYIFKLAQRETPLPKNPAYAAHPQPVEFRDIIIKLAFRIYERRVKFIPIPGVLIFIGISILEFFSFKTRIRSDSVRSFLNPNPHPKFDAKVEKEFKSLDEILKLISS